MLGALTIVEEPAQRLPLTKVFSHDTEFNSSQKA